MTDRKAKLAETNYYDEFLGLRDRQREHLKSSLQVIHEDELPLETNRQGLMRWYMHPSITDTILSTHLFFSQEIPPGSRSGRVKFQGEQIIFVAEGSGYTLVDGVKHPWTAGDVLNMPVRKKGIVVQHFNPDPETPVKLIVAEPNFYAWATVDRGSGFEQLEDAPEYQAAMRNRARG